MLLNKDTRIIKFDSATIKKDYLSSLCNISIWLLEFVFFINFLLLRPK
jgi:hypothetical protein